MPSNNIKRLAKEIQTTTDPEMLMRLAGRIERMLAEAGRRMDIARANIEASLYWPRMGLTGLGIAAGTGALPFAIAALSKATPFPTETILHLNPESILQRGLFGLGRSWLGFMSGAAIPRGNWTGSLVMGGLPLASMIWDILAEQGGPARRAVSIATILGPWALGILYGLVHPGSYIPKHRLPLAKAWQQTKESTRQIQELEQLSVQIRKKLKELDES